MLTKKILFYWNHIFQHFIFRQFFIFLCCLSLFSCALFGRIFPPDLEQEKQDRFLAATGHDMLKILFQEDRLGYVFENDIFVKKVWGGKVVEQAVNQEIRIVYERKDFDKLKLFIGDDLSIGPSLENIHYMILRLENVKRYELVDFQPLVAYMGTHNVELLKKPFVASMIKAAKYSVEAYQKMSSEIEGAYIPHPMVMIKAKTGTESKNSDEQYGYNAFVGYKLFDGSQWILDFEKTPKVQVYINSPQDNEVIKNVRVRIKGSLIDYHQLPEHYKNQLRLYVMVRNEYQDDWILQTKARLDPNNGKFEAIALLGDLERGNGHRYSVVAFVSYFDINRESNSTFPFLPFNKGQYLVNVQRNDEDF